MSRNVHLYRSKPKGLKYGNFGDELSLPLMERFFGITPVPTSMQKAELIAVGSILDAYSRARMARRLLVSLTSRRDPLHVWGSGFMLEDSSGKWPRPVTIHAVRGHLSAARITNFSGAIGDPGILASRLIARAATLYAQVSLVPHFVDEGFVGELELPSHWQVVHPDGDPIDVITKISNSELVISSSLHGLIIADSYEIPAIWAVSKNDLYRKSHYKFFDHASARGVSFNEPKTYMELTKLNENQLHALATQPSRNIGSWQDAVISAFPFR